MNILVAAQLSEVKLKSILDPLIYSDKINEIYLVRRYLFISRRVSCYCPPEWMQSSAVLSEIWRVYTIFWLCLSKKIDYLIGIHYVYHGIYVALAGLVFRKPFILSIIEDPKQYKKSFWFRFFILSARKVFVRGRQSRRFLKELTNIELSKVEVLTDVVDLSLPLPLDNGLVSKKYDLIFLGEFTASKRFDILLQTVSKLRELHPPLKVLLIGDGEMHYKVEHWLDEFKVRDCIDWVGQVPNDRIGDFLSQSKVFIMTSDTEGLPMTIIETLNYGLPFVLSDVGDIADVVVDEDNGLLVKTFLPEDFARACHRLLSDEKFYDKCMESNLRLKLDIKQFYTLPYLIEQWNRILV